MLRCTTIAAICLGASLAAHPAEAREWSLGSNLGLSFLSPDEGDGVTYLALPGSVVGLQPGLRVSMRVSPRHEWYADTGVLLTTSEGFSNRSLGLIGNYQLNFASSGTTSPYVTAGIGFLHAGREIGDVEASATSASFGFGAGLRRALRGDNATLRAELRYDRVTKGEDDGVVLVQDGGVIGIKFGFDVWLGEPSTP